MITIDAQAKIKIDVKDSCSNRRGEGYEAEAKNVTYPPSGGNISN